MRNWKRIIAAVGTAALLISNLGTVSQAVFATENYTENAEPTEENHDGDEGTENLTSESGDTNGGENVVTMNVADLLGGTGEGSGSVTLAPVSENGDEHPAGGTDANPSDAPDATGDDETGSGGANTGETGSTTPGTQDGGNNESDNVGGDGSQGQQGEGSNDGSDGSDDADGTDKGESTDGTDTGTDTGEDPDITPANPDDPDDSGNDDPDKTYALNDSLEVTLETKESGNHDVKRGDNGDYLYNLGETASTTVTLTNPADYRLDETDGAVLRVYMQFKDTAATDIDGVPYKDETKVNEDVAAADVADLIANDAAFGTSETTDATSTSKTPATDTSKASPHNGSTAGTKKAGEDTVQAASGTSYTYTVTERGDGLYEYEFQRPISGDTYSVELTSTYSKETTGGSNKIWAEIIPGEDETTDENPTETTSSEDENTVDAETSDEDTPDTEDTADTENTAEQPSENQETKQPKAELVKIDGQTLRWVADVNLVNKKTTQTAETENYAVSVTYGADSQLPAEAELRVTEYGPETEVYQRITEQTGEMYDWLLDISFYYNDLQLEPQAPVSLKVTAKTVETNTAEDGENDISTVSLDNETKTETTADEDVITTITHFADTGTEVIENDVEVTTTDDGESEISFILSSLSLAAGVTYRPATVVSASSFTSNNQYLIYKVSGDYVYFLAYDNNTAVTFRVALSNIVLKNKDVATESDITDLGDVLYLNKESSIKGDIITSRNGSYETYMTWTQLCWTYTGRYLQNAYSGGYLTIGSRQVYTSNGSGSRISASVGSSNKYTQFEGDDYYLYGWIVDTNYLNFSSGNYYTGSGSYWDRSDVTLAQVGGSGSDETGSTDPTAITTYKTAVYTGNTDPLPLAFYTVRVGENNTLEAIPGVHYTIYDEQGEIALTFTTSDDMRVNISSLPPGSYTMKMTEVPEGYVCDGDTWSFTIAADTKALDLKDSGGISQGIIIVNPESSMTMGKTASVVNYANRTYQVDLNAQSALKDAKISGLKVHFVVDQSNSMLFPADMTATNLTFTAERTVAYSKSGDTENLGEIKVHDSDLWNLTGSTSGSGTTGKLDKDVTYYFIAADSTSSTVFALYYDNNRWKYQDASYYAKAYHRIHNTGLITTEDTCYYPSKSDFTAGSGVNGGYFAGNLVGSTVQTDLGGKSGAVGKSKTYTLYTSTNQYNRLHYLEQSLVEMMQMLAAMNPNVVVTLDTFRKEPIYCSGEKTLNAANLNELMSAVGNITTGDGTRQDYALRKTYNDHLANSTDKENEYVILITDGAPVKSGSDKDNGDEDNRKTGDATYVSSNENSKDHTVYEHVNYWAKQVKNKATLATVGLGINNVESGSISMRYISSDYTADNQTHYNNAKARKDSSGNSYKDDNGNPTTAHGEWWYQPENSSEITSILCDRILKKIVTAKDVAEDQATVVDYISDSFYPIDLATNKPVESGARIDAEGNIVGNGQGIGTIRQDSNGTWYVQWDKTTIAGTSEQTVWYDSWVSGSTGEWHNGKWMYKVTKNVENKFTGRVYLKAKEDFIGGNAINTNKSATLTMTGSGSSKKRLYDYDKPTVNVHLLDMKEMNTEVTVYKGDTINETGNSPLDSVKYFYTNVEIEKLVSGGGNVLNYKTGATEANGCKDATFTIPYATGVQQLTSEQWETLKNSGTVTLPYSYGDVDGELGYFTFTMSKSSVTTPDTSNWDAHEATVTSGKDENGSLQAVETYTLTVTYTAYKLGESGRPGENEYNGTAGPGTEVGGAEAGDTLNEGKKTVDSTNVHKVYVIDGTIRIWKETDDLASTNQTFEFSLYRKSDTAGGQDELIGTTQSVTVVAGAKKSITAAEWTGLKRGTYYVVEGDSNKNYTFDQITVDTSTTNCQYTGSGTPNVTFVLGNNTSGTNVIGRNPANAIYTSYIDSPNGVLGEASIMNKLIKYELPKTGGEGTLPLELGGFAAMLGSMFVGYSRRRRHRKEGEM